jgi:hypothetical protein
MDYIKFEEELNIRRNMKEPHLSYIEDSIVNRRRVSVLVLSKKENEILLIDSYGFMFDSVFAGLTEKHIEYIAKNGPRDYKTNILKLLRDQEMMKGVFEIAKAMDEDLGEKITKNQERVRNVIQYIKDNRMVFEF